MTKDLRATTVEGWTLSGALRAEFIYLFAINSPFSLNADSAAWGKGSNSGFVKVLTSAFSKRPEIFVVTGSEYYSHEC